MTYPPTGPQPGQDPNRDPNWSPGPPAHQPPAGPPPGWGAGPNQSAPNQPPWGPPGAAPPPVPPAQPWGGDPNGGQYTQQFPAQGYATGMQPAYGGPPPGPPTGPPTGPHTDPATHPAGPPTGPQWGGPQWGGPQWGGPAGAAPWGPPTGAPPKRRRGRGLIAAAAAIIVVGGAAATYVAVSDKNSAGAATPKDAVTALVDDLNQADLLGVLDHLPPAERDAIVDPIKDQVSQLKRLKVLSQSADLSDIAGIEITAKDLTFENSYERITSTVQVVKLTGGTIEVNADFDKIPYTKQFLDVAFPGGGRPTGSQHWTIDVGRQVQRMGEPIRIATQNVDGKWYASLLYTIADNSVHSGHGTNPTEDQRIPAEGAGSAEDAVRKLLTAASRQDVRGVLAVMSPDEDAVLHDYGALIVSSSPSDEGDPLFTFKDVQFNTSKVSGGTLVSIRKATVTLPNGSSGTYEVDGDCLRFSSDGDTGSFCGDDLGQLLPQGTDLNAEQREAVQHLFTALPKIGIVATQSDGQWYISLLRTVGDFTVAIFSGLHDNDLLALLELMNR